MSLRAVVYCDCVEKGLLRIPHPLPDLLSIDPSGCPAISSEDAADAKSHDRWEVQRPCPHDRFWLIERYLGNISSIGVIRQAIDGLSASDQRGRYPVLLSKVLYSGSHSGDFLTIEEVVRLRDELDHLRKTLDEQSDNRATLREFLSRMDELVCASLTVGKPISF